MARDRKGQLITVGAKAKLFRNGHQIAVGPVKRVDHLTTLITAEDKGPEGALISRPHGDVEMVGASAG
ncbi:MAG: hypothetical protein ABIB97_01690 [Patescibacteria group bacterium]